MIPRQWLGSCTFRRRCIPCVGTAILESQNKRASPEDHCGRPHLPVSQCRFLLAFDGQTASSEPDTEWTFLLMKISKAVYVRRSGSQQERLWLPGPPPGLILDNCNVVMVTVVVMVMAMVMIMMVMVL